MISRKKSVTPANDMEGQDGHMTLNGAKLARKGNVAMFSLR